MTATVALGDSPQEPFVDFHQCDCPERSSNGYECTGRVGHLSGDLPHVAYGIVSGCLAIWDGMGREVDLDRHGVGATLMDASAVTS